MAAIACAATLGLIEPHMTGAGGDMFALFYDAKTGTVSGINGSGRATSHLSYDELVQSLGDSAAQKKTGVPGIPGSSIHAVTVPGAVAGWVDTIEHFGNGKLTVAQVLEPAIKLARGGVQIPEVSADLWEGGVELLRGQQDNCDILVPDESHSSKRRAVKAGEVYKNEPLAQVYERIGKHGKAGFYEGETAKILIDTVKKRGGKLDFDDLKNHTSTILPAGSPISTVWPASDGGVGLRVHEIPPNGQGIIALQAIAILRVLQKRGDIPLLSTLKHNSPEYIHILTEVFKSAWRDVGIRAIGDLSVDENKEILNAGDGKGVEHYLTDEYIEEQLNKGEKSYIRFDKSKISDNTAHIEGNVKISYGSKSDTVYMSATDQWGNACSLINSIYAPFGSGIVPHGLGFPLHNRGANFNIVKGSVNCYQPNKRPYHTIIPAMITQDSQDESGDDSVHKGKLYATYGVMGGFMQPQGHVQVMLNLSVFGMNEQEALDAPRICLMPYEEPVGDKAAETLSKLGGSPGGPTTTAQTIIAVEEGITEDTIEKLKQLGHKVSVKTGSKRGLFGRGQLIREGAYGTSDGSGPRYSAGSDPRGDGAAIPQLY